MCLFQQTLEAGGGGGGVSNLESLEAKVSDLFSTFARDAPEVCM